MLDSTTNSNWTPNTTPKKKKAAVGARQGILLLLVLLGCSTCRDVIFNNRLDPNASKEMVEIIRVIDTGLGGKGDLCFDGEKFWKIDGAGNLNAIDRESGAIIRSFPAEPGTGISFFDNMLYFCQGDGNNILYTMDPLSGDILNRVSTGSIAPAFITSKDNKLIIYDSRSSGIFEYDTETGNLVSLFQVPGINIGGIESFRQGLLITDMNTNSLYYFLWNGTVDNVYSSPAAGIVGVTADTAATTNETSYVYLMMLDGKIYKVQIP